MVKHPPPAELAGFPGRQKMASAPLLEATQQRCWSQVAGGAQGCPCSTAHRTAKQPAQSLCHICQWWAEGCPPWGDGPMAWNRAGRAPAGTYTPVPSPVLPGTITGLATEGNIPVRVPGTNIQSSATNSGNNHPKPTTTMTTTKKKEAGGHQRQTHYMISVLQKHTCSILFHCRIDLNCTLLWLSSFHLMKMVGICLG